MQQAKSAPDWRSSWPQSGSFVHEAGDRSELRAVTSAAAVPRNKTAHHTGREYQRGLSKAMMKVKR